MDNHTKAVVEECTHRSDANAITFPQVVQRLAEAGVERYHADLGRCERTYYLPDGASHVVTGVPIDGRAPERFAAQDVEAAVRAIQRGEIAYTEFCERIVAAGCVGYFVTLAGRRAVYYGRSGDEYVEPFPPVK